MDTREAIIDAAVREFSQSGYHKTSMDQIAASAQLSKGALYYFYKNKAELFLAVVEEGLKILNREIDEIMEEDLGAKEMIYRIVKAYVNTCLDNREFALILLNENVHGLDTELAENIRECADGLSRRLMDILAIGEAYGYLRKCNREVVAMLFWGMLRSACAGMERLSYKPDRKEMIDTIYGVIADGICERG